MRKFIVSAITLVSLSSMSFLAAAGPASAKKMTCLQKAQACERRCAKSYSDWNNCVVRTCNVQYGTCGN
jgi:hypothetical protein